MGGGQAVFYIGWLLENGLVYCAEYNFILRMLGERGGGAKKLVRYLCIQCALTLCALAFCPPVPLRELLHLGAACVFFLKKERGLQRRQDSAHWAFTVTVAVAVLFAVSSFVYGLSTTVLRLLAANLTVAHPVPVCVVPVMLLSVGLLAALLRVAAWQWHRPVGQPGFGEGRHAPGKGAVLGIGDPREERLFLGRGYLPRAFLLLMPCAFAVWVVRFGLGLDCIRLQSVSAPFAAGAPVWAFVCLLGASAAFFCTIGNEVSYRTKKAFMRTRARGKSCLSATALDVARAQSAHFFAVPELASGFPPAGGASAPAETVPEDGEAEALFLGAQPDAEPARLCALLMEERRCNARYRSFQHDIDNHLLVLSGLLREKRYRQMRRYLARLWDASQGLRTAVATGNPALDVLLREKAGYARQQGIAVSCSVRLPSRTGIKDVDLCAVFSNAADNAVSAAVRLPQKERTLRIAAGMRRGFLLVEVANACLPDAVAQPGTGLSNIADIARKYQGTMDCRNDSGIFRLTVLLCARTDTE